MTNLAECLFCAFCHRPNSCLRMSRQITADRGSGILKKMMSPKIMCARRQSMKPGERATSKIPYVRRKAASSIEKKRVEKVDTKIPCARRKSQKSTSLEKRWARRSKSCARPKWTKSEKRMSPEILRFRSKIDPKSTRCLTVNALFFARPETNCAAGVYVIG